MSDTPGQPDIVAVHDQVCAAFQKLVDGIREDQWSAPTPCTDWDVRALLNHVISGNLWFANNIRGGGGPLDRSRDFVGADASRSYADSVQQLHDAFTAPGTMEGRFPSPMGEQPGPVLVNLRITETLTHGWDLGRATGQTLDVPGPLVEQVLAGVRPALAGMPREGGPFKPEQQAPDDAPPLDRLAAFLGRQP